MCSSKPLGYINEQNKYPCPQEAYGPAWFPYLYNEDDDDTYLIGYVLLSEISEMKIVKHFEKNLAYGNHCINVIYLGDKMNE